MKGFIKSYVLASTVTNRTYAKCTVIQSDGTSSTINVWGAPNKLYTGCVVSISDNKLQINDKGVSTNFTDLMFEDVKNYPDFLKYVESAPSKEEIDNLIDRLFTVLTPTNRVWISSILRELFIRYENHPAARSNHHAYKGGLSRHTYEILNMFLYIYRSLPFKVNPDIVVLASVFHDYGKMYEYNINLELTDQFYLVGHPVMSAQSAMQWIGEKTTDRSLLEHVVHAVLAHHGRKEWGSPVEPATPEAFLVHHLDMLSGHGYSYEHASPGEKIFALGNKPVIKYND